MNKNQISVLLIISLNFLFPFKTEAINLNKNTIKLECQKKLLGVFEYTYPIAGKFNITDVKIIYTKNKIYTFREYPNFYFVECIEWVDSCTYKTYKCELHDPILDEKTEDTTTSVEQFTQIVGNKFYFKRFKNQKLTNEGYIRKTSNDIPIEFR
ncbi:hypothetical protein NUH30_10695 [Leptospira sp. 85282-16]|uniref:Uncharacterized protein n=1 Tax=Leptospira montravelensis TaxID=2484961 RepID=A0ABY2LND0_9LEPT|nr:MULTISPECIES: hypothetical protein [Leptospira]MCT8334141.1 hypothetical protein [Leptospira sp. 85282-16]TGK80523.1 hypothetical protein EHQ19_12690 [Leptospira montravelensis]TGL00701.1 hypothetical protein EHQ31_18120 [Leptospira montravelensis]